MGLSAGVDRARSLGGLFERFTGYLSERGYQAKAGQIIDASIVPVPRQRNTREENAAIKGGALPEGWEDNPARRRQKNTDARWTKKHGKSYFGYKNHINVDNTHKLIARSPLPMPPPTIASS